MNLVRSLPRKALTAFINGAIAEPSSFNFSAKAGMLLERRNDFEPDALFPDASETSDGAVILIFTSRG